MIFLDISRVLMGWRSTGSVKLTVHPEEIYTITTLKTGKKGVAPSPSPPSTPFPIPFTQDFDHENISAPPAYWYRLRHRNPRNKTNDHLERVSASFSLFPEMTGIYHTFWGLSFLRPEISPEVE